MECHILRDVQHKRRFSHGRAGGHQYKIRRLQPGCPMIKIDESRSNSSDISFFLGSQFNFLQGIDDNLLDWHKIFRSTVLKEVKNLLFSLRHNVLYAVFIQIALAGNLLIDFNQPAQHGFLFDDIRIVFDVRRSRH